MDGDGLDQLHVIAIGGKLATIFTQNILFVIFTDGVRQGQASIQCATLTLK